ncbi:MAG: BrnT family toxin [Candidatus Binatia bacterium]
MKITDLVWLDEFIEKIEAKHNVFQWEVDEVFTRKPKIRKMKKGRFRGEDVYRALGRTEAGRYLAVFFIHKRTGAALILSARDMDGKERKIYATK